MPTDRPYDGVDLMPYLLGKNRAAPPTGSSSTRFPHTATHIDDEYSV
jgi:hypothetical protein